VNGDERAVNRELDGLRVALIVLTVMVALLALVVVLRVVLLVTGR